jgi:ribosomal protein L4
METTRRRGKTGKAVEVRCTWRDEATQKVCGKARVERIGEDGACEEHAQDPQWKSRMAAYGPSDMDGYDDDSTEH